MTTSRRIGKRLRIGLALRGDLLVARAAPSALPGDAWSRTLTEAPDTQGAWPDLERAMGELRALLPATAKVTASVMLLPPLVQLRNIDLPPLRPDERRRALTRDASRWFVGAREPQIVDAVPTGIASAVVAAAVPMRFAEAIVRAGKSAGIAVRTVQPAPWGWAALLEPARRDSTLAMVVPGPHGVDIIQLARGTVTAVRRLRIGDGLTHELNTLLAAEGATGASAVVIGSGALAESLTTGLGVRGIARRDDAAGLAASMAAHVRGPELLPEDARAAHAVGVTRTARTLAFAATALALMAAGVELWGGHRQLAGLKQERATIHNHVERAIAARDSVTVLEAQFSVVATTAHAAPRWTAVLVDLTRALPDDAHLVSFAAAGDSIMLVGEAAHAADVFDALRRDVRIAGVRADAPIRREFGAGRSQVERFSVIARLTPAGLTAMPPVEARSAEAVP
jgi:hypothetical protein